MTNSKTPAEKIREALATVERRWLEKRVTDNNDVRKQLQALEKQLLQKCTHFLEVGDQMIFIVQRTKDDIYHVGDKLVKAAELPNEQPIEWTADAIYKCVLQGLEEHKTDNWVIDGMRTSQKEFDHAVFKLAQHEYIHTIKTSSRVESHGHDCPNCTHKWQYFVYSIQVMTTDNKETKGKPPDKPSTKCIC